VEKYDKARLDTGDSIIRRMRIECWITKATDTHSEYLIVNCSSKATMVTRLLASMLDHTHTGRLASHCYQHVLITRNV
jgi:hypothetical protein